METRKSRTTWLIFLIATLISAHAHYVPCTKESPPQAIANPTTVHSATDADIEKPRSTSVDTTAETLSPAVMPDATDSIDTKPDNVGNVVVNGNYDTFDTVAISNPTGIVIDTEVDVATPTRTATNSRRTAGIDTPRTPSSADAYGGVGVTTHTDATKLSPRNVIDNTTGKPHAVPTKTSGSYKQTTAIPFRLKSTTSIDTTPKTSIDILENLKTTAASAETTTNNLNGSAAETGGTSRLTTNSPSTFEITAGINIAASTKNVNASEITSGIDTTTNPKTSDKMSIPTNSSPLQLENDTRVDTTLTTDSGSPAVINTSTTSIDSTTAVIPDASTSIPEPDTPVAFKVTTSIDPTTAAEIENPYGIDTTIASLPTDQFETTAVIDATVTGIDSDPASTSRADTTNPPTTPPKSTLFASAAPGETPNSPLASPTIPPNLYSPVFYEDVYYSEVPENSPVGTLLCTVQALDWDRGDASNITYGISGGAAGADGREAFAVHPKTGAVAVAGELDRETKGAYVIELTATDQGIPPRRAEAQLQMTLLDVNDNPPIFEKASYEALIDEDAHAMSRVLHVTATDDDLGKNGEVTYRLSGNHKNTFSIDERSGLIRTRLALDRERIARYTFAVVATDTDRGAPLHETAVGVLVRVGDVNDNAPRFPSATIHLNVTENNLPFGPIGKVTATDADEGHHAQVSYAFVQQHASQTRYRFQIERVTGIVHTLYRFDREQRSEYEAVVRASSGSLFTDARLVIHILDLNDNAPVVPPTQELFYNFYAGFTGCHAIGKVGALDKDIGDSFSFRLLPEKNYAGGDGGRNPSVNSSYRYPVSLGISITLDENTGIIHACHRQPSIDQFPSKVQLAIQVSDGLHRKTCSYTIYLSQVDDQSLGRVMSLRLRIRSDTETFLSRYRDFLSALAGVFKTTEELVTLMVRGSLLARSPSGVSQSPLAVKAILAVRRRDGTAVAPDEVRSLAFLETEQLERFADILPDPARPQCRLVPAVAAGGRVVVTEVALGLSYAAFNVSLKVSCERTPPGTCGGGVCGEFEECIVGQHPAGEREDQSSCRCLFPGSPNCQPPFQAGSCSEAVCNHRGSCAVDGSGGVGCSCRDQGRYDGPRCQMTTRGFTDGSFLAFLPLGRFSREFHISLRFKTLQSDGLLLFNGQLGGMRGESVALQIVGGRLHFVRSGRLDANAATGSGSSVARNVSDGAWHEVHISHAGGSVLMGIDNCTSTAAAWNVTSANPACLGIGVQRKTPRAKFLNLNGPLFLGGLPSFVTAYHVTPAHFEGCLSGVRFNSALLDFSTRLKNVGTSPRCSERHDLRETLVAKVKVPRAVRSLSVRPRTRSLVVKWIPPKDKAGHVTGYKMSYAEVNEYDEPISVTRTIFINGASERGFTVERLTPATRYRVDIRAFSPAGLGEPSSEFAVTKSPRPNKR